MAALLTLENISKSFGVVKALNSLCFSVEKEEIHTILGENGAGKTTLMKIISGNIYQDEGKIFFDNEEIIKPNPRLMRKKGVAIVYQELSIFKNLTVAENIFPENEFKYQAGFINKRKMNIEVKKKLQLFDLDIEPEEKMEKCSLAEQQIIEILRAISHNPKLLILDEPTSALNNKEASRLFEIIKKLKSGGLSILYISHHLSEVMEISDRITILKDGKYVTTLKRNEVATEDLLIKLMVGRNIESLYGKKDYGLQKNHRVFLELNNLSKKDFFKSINFKLLKGEILGIYGLQGSGRQELMKLIFGLNSFDGGYIKVNNKKYNHVTPSELIDNGIMYLSEDREDSGLFLNMSVYDNIACPSLDSMFKNNLINKDKVITLAMSLIKRFKVKVSSISNKPIQLSGGNKQKLMTAMCTGNNLSCLIANEPTRGIDVGSKADIHIFLKNLSDDGTSIILVSSELPEIINLSDRVLVMKNREIVGELIGNQIVEEKIVTLAAGSSNKNNKLE